MGVLDAGSFDNDDALDWVDKFAAAPGRKLIQSTLRTAANKTTRYLEAPESCMAIAAAEVVAALRNAPHPRLPEEIQEALSHHKIAADQNLVDLALKAVERIKTDSELKALWEYGDASEWFAAINDLEARLRQ